MIDNKKFTLYNIKEIDDKINSDLKLIVDKVTKLLGKNNIYSILLTGSFGKGEGGAFLHNGKVKVINDYDISIIHPRGNLYKLKNKNRIVKLGEELADKINIKQIDLSLISTSEINEQKRTIGYYDLLYGHYLLYGKDPFANNTTKLRSKDIPLFEGSWLLRNRGLGLILAGLYFIGEDNDSFINKENLWIEINKAKLAIGDSLLIANKNYHWSCIERLKRISSLEDNQYYKEALSSKLEHRGIPYNISNQELIDEWFKIKDYFLSYFLKYENSRLNSNFENWSDYLQNLNKISGNTSLKYWYYVLFSEFKKIKLRMLASKIKFDKNLSIGLIGMLLDVIITKNSIDKNKISRLKYYLKSNKYEDNEISNWTVMSKFFLLSIHPEGEAKKVAISK